MIQQITVRTTRRTEMLDITSEVSRIVRQSGIRSGTCLVYIPHTTAGVTINENADPSVPADILMELNKLIPFEDGYSHGEGNSAAHIKSSLLGCSQIIPVEDGTLVLGTWQGIFFCEFDGPRSRKALVQIAGK